MLKNFPQLRERFFGGLRLATANASQDGEGLDGAALYQSITKTDADNRLNLIESVEKPGRFSYTKDGVAPEDDGRRTRNRLSTIMLNNGNRTPASVLDAVAEELTRVLGNEGCKLLASILPSLPLLPHRRGTQADRNRL